MKNEKFVIPILLQFLYLDWCMGLHLILLNNVILQRYYCNITIKTFYFVTAHLTASNKGELANQNAAYKIIALEFIWPIQVYLFYLYNLSLPQDYHFHQPPGQWCQRFPRTTSLPKSEIHIYVSFFEHFTIKQEKNLYCRKWEITLSALYYFC